MNPGAPRACPCFAGSSCTCAANAGGEISWRGRRAVPQTLRDAHRDYRACAAHGLVAWSPAAWQIFLEGYVITSTWYQARASVRARAAYNMSTNRMGLPRMSVAAGVPWKCGFCSTRIRGYFGMEGV